MQRSTGEKIFSGFNYVFLTLLALLTIYPFWEIIRLSLSNVVEANTLVFRLFPQEVTFDAYKHVIDNEFIWVGYKNTAIRIIVGVSIQMALMIGLAFPLSKKTLPCRKYLTLAIIFTMFFHGGMIPSYLLVRSLRIDNSIWALVLPHAVNTFSMFIIRNYFMSLPAELEESAKIDGASLFTLITRIILPLSLPILMTVGLWCTVWHWNAWFDCLIYIKDSDKYVLQAVLRKIIIDAAPQFDNTSVDAGETVLLNAEVIKAATIIVSTLPILVVYPFIQKYFVKGVMVGSLKG